MQSFGVTTALVVGFIAGGATCSPVAYLWGKLERAAADRRAAWSTHKTLIGTIRSLFTGVIGYGAIALIVLAVLVFGKLQNHPTQAGHNSPLPVMSSSTSHR